MLRSIDVEKGQLYLLKLGKEEFRARLIKVKSDGDLLFERVADAIRFPIDRNDFIAMRALLGTAVLIVDVGNGFIEAVIEPGGLDPEYPTDSPKVKARKKRYRKAWTRKYIIDLIRATKTPKSVFQIQKLLKTHEKDFKRNGFELPLPHPTTLMRLYTLSERMGQNSIQFFLGKGGGDRKAGLVDDVTDGEMPWQDFVKSRLWNMVRWYYSKEAPKPVLAKKICRAEIAAERQRRLSNYLSSQSNETGGSGQVIMIDDGHEVRATTSTGKKDLFKTPTPATFQNWLDRNASRDNTERRAGKTVRAHQIDGNQEHIEAFRPLECVVMDHTTIDMFIVVLDVDGKVLRTFRPHLIIVMDIFSRMVLAANLTEDAPSLYTLKEGLKQGLKPKSFLDRYAITKSYFWATDGWGWFRRMVLDNGLENVGVSLKASGDAVGMDITFSPIATPTVKAIGERFFHTINAGVWHQADGGVEGKPGTTKEDPSKNAFLTLEAAQQKLWNWIVSVYHLRPHDDLRMAPARKWSIGMKAHKRPMIADMNAVDNVFGKYVTRELTTAGINYNNEVYHDADATSLLLSDLLRYNRNKHKGRKKYQSASISVSIVDGVDDRQVEYITVYNPVRKSYVRLPNVVTGRTGTFAQREIQRQIEDRDNEDFFSSDDIAVNDALHLAGLTRLETPEFSRPGSESESGKSGSKAGALAGIVKFSDHNSVHNPAIHTQIDSLDRRPAARRGGQKATKKAAETRRRNQEEKRKFAKELEEKVQRAATRRLSSDKTPVKAPVDDGDAVLNIAALLVSRASTPRCDADRRNRLLAKLKNGGSL